MQTSHLYPAAALLLTLNAAQAQTTPQTAATSDGKPAAEQVITPEVARRPVPLPRIPSRDFFGGLYAGSYATQNFGSSAALGLRLGYHITEDVFVEGAIGGAKVSDGAFRQILPGGIFVQPSERLTYATASAGYNAITGEAFFGGNRAKAMQAYLLGGIGATRLADQRHQTLVLGAGWRLILGDHLTLQVDLREHVFSLDLLGKRQSTRNPEFTFGLTGNF